MVWIAFALTFAALIGSALLGWAAILIAARSRRLDIVGPAQPVSLLKPLHGDEPGLVEKLIAAIDQDYPAAFELICGVARADDPAVAAVDAARAARPDVAITLVVDGRQTGNNAKVSNLAHCAARARCDLLVLADSDMLVGRDYLARIAGTLAQPGVGAVSCLYVGMPEAGLWSRLVASGIDGHFLPATEIGLATGMAHPCMGSTIALTRSTLDAIGGFDGFADVLADDHAIGAAVRAQGLDVRVPAMVLSHGCAHDSLTALWRQELRWQATIAGIDPMGHAGSFILHPFPLALAALVCGGGAPAGIAVVAALAARAAVLVAAARLPAPGPRRRPPIALIPLRDCLSFALFLASFVVRSVDWRGTTLTLGGDGRLSPEDSA